MTSRIAMDKYRETIRRCTRIIIHMYASKNKAKCIIWNVCNMTFLASGDIVQKLISHAERTITIDLASEESRKDQSKLIEGVISVISKECPLGKVRQELYLFTGVSLCVLKAYDQHEQIERLGWALLHRNHEIKLER